MTSVTKCYPGRAKNGSGDRVPSRAEQKLCRPYLDAELVLVDPALVIPIGRLAISLFFPPKLALAEIIVQSPWIRLSCKQAGHETKTDNLRIVKLGGGKPTEQTPATKASESVCTTLPGFARITIHFRCRKENMTESGQLLSFPISVVKCAIQHFVQFFIAKHHSRMIIGLNLGDCGEKGRQRRRRDRSVYRYAVR